MIPPHRKKKFKNTFHFQTHKEKYQFRSYFSNWIQINKFLNTPVHLIHAMGKYYLLDVFPINTKNDALLSSKNAKFLCANPLITRTDDFSACPLVTGPQLHERSRDLIIASFFDLLSHGIVWSFCIFFCVRIKKITSMFFVVLCNQSGCFAHQFLHFRCLAMQSHFLELGIRLELSICFAYCPA